jgi:hypothetical protein
MMKYNDLIKIFLSLHALCSLLLRQAICVLNKDGTCFLWKNVLIDNSKIAWESKVFSDIYSLSFYVFYSAKIGKENKYSYYSGFAKVTMIKSLYYETLF